jgi:hypothetical protein
VLHGPRQYPVHIVFNNVSRRDSRTWTSRQPAVASPNVVLGDGRYYNSALTAGPRNNIQVASSLILAATASRGRAPMYEYNVAGPRAPHVLDVTTEPRRGIPSLARRHSCDIRDRLAERYRVGDTPTSFALHGNVPNPFKPDHNDPSTDFPASGADVNISITSSGTHPLVVERTRGAENGRCKWNGEKRSRQSVAFGRVLLPRMRAGSLSIPGR